MTDHRVNDLSYGHLGEATYDPDEHTWLFSRSGSLGASIQALQPFQEILQASLSPLPINSKRVSQIWNAQNQWLAKAVPETGPASGMLSLLNREAQKSVEDLDPATLLAVGVASDIDQARGRNTRILALPSGEAGNLLRLIKPRTEVLGWHGHHGIKLRVLNPASLEECYWLGEGGPIKQITFGTDTDGPTSWLAVRRAESTSVLRPIFCRLPLPSTLPQEYIERNKPSRISPNHIFTLGIDKMGGNPHADVSFNPWYVRQFAIVDQQGYWNIWDIEGQKRKRATFELVPGKSGHVHDSRSIAMDSKPAKIADGWARVLWAGSVSTLVVCERRSLGVFSLKAQPKRLVSPELVDSRSTDWILDIKRDLTRMDQIYVLTTTQIFWIQISPLGEDDDEKSRDVGARIRLSCRHFRDGEDGTLKLELVQQDDACIVFLYSGQNELVKTYHFGMSTDDSAVPICFSSSFSILNDDQSRSGTMRAMHSLCIVPSSFVQNSLFSGSGPAMEYLDRDVQFFQLLAVDKYLALCHSLCSKTPTSGMLTGVSPSNGCVLPPNMRSARGLNALSSALVEDDHFIVPDGLDDNDDANEVSQVQVSGGKNGRKAPSDQSLAINAIPLFELAFGVEENALTSGQPGGKQNVANYIADVSQKINARRASGHEMLTPLLGITEYTSFSDDIDDVSSMLSEMVEALELLEDDDVQVKTTIAFIETFSFSQGGSPVQAVSGKLQMSAVYDKLVDLWVSSLPREAPGPTRLAKEKLVRNIATELYLSSVVVSVRDKAVSIPQPKEAEHLRLVLPVRGKDESITSRERQPEVPYDSTAGYNSSILASVIPTPGTTPSVTSREASTLSGDPKEDDSISRLRGYALSIRSQAPLNTARSSILAHWPIAPGTDPLNYSWEDARRNDGGTEDLDSDEEDAFVRQKEEARRQRREEKFLKRQRVTTVDSTSDLVAVVTSGSQPDPVQHVASSQIVGEIPMSQPDRGVFGSRQGQKAFKKRRTRGF